jgi:glycosyltransferase involved in cell wall biosynthesis
MSSGVTSKSLTIAMVAACPFPAAFASSGLIRELSQALRSSGHRVHVVTYHLGLEGFDVDGIHIHRIPKIPFYRKICSGISTGKPLLDGLLTLKLLEVIRSVDIDVIHAHNYEAPPAGYFARYFTGIPVVYHAHNTMYHELPSYFSLPALCRLARFIGRKLDQWIPSRADEIITLSEAQSEYLCKTGVPESKIHLIPPAIYPEAFEGGDRESIRARLSLKDEPLIIYTGGLQPYQNCQVLIPVMQSLLKSIPDAHLLIVARSTPESLRLQAVQAGIDNRIHFMQNVGLDWDRNCLAAADVAVIPRTHCIGFPVKMLNYLAASKPVVCFESLANTFVNGREVLAVKTGDPEAMSIGIRQVITRPELRKTLSEEGYKAALARHHWNSVVPEIEQLYRHAITRRVGSHTVWARQ